jgi:hypothetical protein
MTRRHGCLGSALRLATVPAKMPRRSSGTLKYTLVDQSVPIPLLLSISHHHPHQAKPALTDLSPQSSLLHCTTCRESTLPLASRRPGLIADHHVQLVRSDPRYRLLLQHHQGRRDLQVSPARLCRCNRRRQGTPVLAGLCLVLSVVGDDIVADDRSSFSLNQPQRISSTTVAITPTHLRNHSTRYQPHQINSALCPFRSRTAARPPTSASVHPASAPAPTARPTSPPKPPARE